MHGLIVEEVESEPQSFLPPCSANHFPFHPRGRNDLSHLLGLRGIHERNKVIQVYPRDRMPLKRKQYSGHRYSP